MLSRRLIRIKVFKTLFAFVGSESDNVNAAQKTLLESCDKVRDLYYFMLNISGPLVRVAEEKIAAGLRKFHPTEAEANPNYKFVRNRFAALLSDDPEFGRICAKRGLGWGEYEPFVRHVYNSMITKAYSPASSRMNSRTMRSSNRSSRISPCCGSTTWPSRSTR